MYVQELMRAVFLLLLKIKHKMVVVIYWVYLFNGTKLNGTKGIIYHSSTQS